MLASPAAKAKAALTRGRYNFCTRPVLKVKVPNKPGELERIAARLGKAKINIDYVYGSHGEGAMSTLVLSVSNVARAAKIVK
jgi:hypothetical protein